MSVQCPCVCLRMRAHQVILKCCLSPDLYFPCRTWYQAVCALRGTYNIWMIVSCRCFTCRTRACTSNLVALQRLNNNLIILLRVCLRRRSPYQQCYPQNSRKSSRSSLLRMTPHPCPCDSRAAANAPLHPNPPLHPKHPVQTWIQHTCPFLFHHSCRVPHHHSPGSHKCRLCRLRPATAA